MAGVSKGWSPHTAGLKRRQRKSSADASKLLSSLGALDIGDDDEDFDFLKMALQKEQKDKDKPVRRGKRKDKSPNKKRSMSPLKNRSLSPTDALRANKKKMEESGTDLTLISQDDIPPEIAEKLSIIANPDTKMKDRIALEVEMRKNPKEEPYLAKFKHKFDNKKFLTKKHQKDEKAEEQLKKNLKEEEQRKVKEQEEFAAAKQRDLDEIKAKEEAEERMKEEVRLHRAKALVQDSEEVRKNAEKMLIGVTEKVAMAEMAELEQKKELEKYFEENKDMTDVEKALAEARLTQKETNNWKNWWKIQHCYNGIELMYFLIIAEELERERERVVTHTQTQFRWSLFIMIF